MSDKNDANDQHDIPDETQTYGTADAPTMSAQPQPRSREVAPVQLGRYRVGGKLGAGGMGVVYEAIDPALDRKVAVKLIRAGRGGASAHARMNREAQAMARLSHPNVLHVYDVGLHDDQVFVAMEYVDGQTLTEWLTPTRSWREVLGAFIDAGRGLAAAHQAGIVHRDFKPDNVLVDRSGRVMVTDFGLARVLGEEVAAGDAVGDADDHDSHRLTLTGAVMGTPRYMSPEQHRGETVDASTDQFAFCVALFEAFYGEPPFQGDSIKELSSSVGAGEVNVRAIEISKVPGRVSDAVLRGLQPAAADRYPSMASLLDALARESSPRRRRIVIAAALAGAVAAASIAAVAARRSSEGGPSCTVGTDRIAAVWGPKRRAALSTAWKDTQKIPDADARVIAALDAWSKRWATEHDDSCRATHERGEQSAEALDLRGRCLDRARDEMDALAAALTPADDATKAQALTAVQRLPRPEACAQIERLRDVPKVPANARARVDAVTKELARVKAHYKASQYKKQLELAKAVVTKATAIGYSPLLAETTYWLGQAHVGTGDRARAEAVLYEATRLAASAKSHALEARAWFALLRLVGLRNDNPDQAKVLERAARTAVARVGDSPDLMVQYELSMGGVLRQDAKYADAAEHFHAGLRWLKKVPGDQTLEEVTLRMHLGESLVLGGKTTEAEKDLRFALAAREREYGKHHPAVERALRAMSLVHRVRGEHKQAIALLERALAIGEKALGPDSQSVGHALTQLSANLSELSMYKRARVSGERALKILRLHYPAGHLFVLTELEGLAGIDARTGNAITALSRYEEILAATLPLKRPERTAVAYVNVGVASHLVKNYKQAIEACSQAVQLLKANRTHYLPFAHACLARGQRDSGDISGAIASMRLAIATNISSKASTYERARSHYTLAGLYWKTGKKREARAEGRKALDIFKARKHVAEIAAVEKWLKNPHE